MKTSPAKWKAVKALFEAALEQDSTRRSSFLIENCTDAGVRAEVERLLAEYYEAGAFLSTPVIPDGATWEGGMPILSPDELLVGRFRIIRYIASGGMGEVYEAEDQELREKIAVKTIRAEVMAQPDALARFKREVRLARKVTHPNVCRIFDLFRHTAEHAGLQREIFFVGMELLSGPTLQEHMKEVGRMRPEQALMLIRPIASALSAAHAAGVVHRDFKPGNVVLVSENKEKVRPVITDFGLAVEEFRSKDSSTAQIVKGTPAYMSPEQLEGRIATSASDIYAFGLVIYEMVAGEKPFKGDTPISAALRRLSERPISPREFNPELPLAWESVIFRCLERDPSERFPSAESVSQALIGGETDHSIGSTTLRRLRKGKHSQRAVAALLGISILTLGLYLYRSSIKNRRSTENDLKVRELTSSSAENFIDEAAMSPDGKYLAYEQRAGPIFLSSIDTGESRVLTPANSDFMVVGWFPDGTHLLLNKWGSLWKISVLTGSLTKIRDNAVHAIISPDGSRILYYSPPFHEFSVMGSDGQGSHRVMVADPNNLGPFCWDPTGRRFAYAVTRRVANGEDHTVIETLDIEAKEQPTVVLSSPEVIGDMSWLPDGRLIYSMAEQPPNEGDSNLWAINVDPVKGQALGKPQRLTNWVGFSVGDIQATADGKRLTFTKFRELTSIYIAPLGTDKKPSLGKVQRLTTDSWPKSLGRWSPDSRAVYFSSYRNGKFSIYRQDILHQAADLIISGPDMYNEAHVSPDGTSLLYLSSATHGLEPTQSPQHLMIESLEGGTPSIIASGGHLDHQCALPPSTFCVLSKEQGNTVSFYSLDPKLGLSAKPLQSTQSGIQWSLSPDGREIAFVENNDKSQVSILGLHDGTVRHLDLGKWKHLQTVSWAVNGRSIYVTSFSMSGDTLLSVDLRGNVVILFQQANNFCCPTSSPNGRFLAFQVWEIHKDVAMIENF